MWLFVREGFFSVVCARQGDGQRGRPIDPERVSYPRLQSWVADKKEK